MCDSKINEHNSREGWEEQQEEVYSPETTTIVYTPIELVEATHQIMEERANNTRNGNRE